MAFEQLHSIPQPGFRLLSGLSKGQAMRQDPTHPWKPGWRLLHAARQHDLHLGGPRPPSCALFTTLNQRRARVEFLSYAGSPQTSSHTDIISSTPAHGALHSSGDA